MEVLKALFSCLKRSRFLFNSGVPHIGTGVALLFGSSQSRLSEGTSCYLILWIRCNNIPCFNNGLERTNTGLSSATVFSDSDLSYSQFQHLFSCSPDSKRRKKMMSKSSPYPVEGESKNISPIMVENFHSLLRMVLDLLALVAQLSGNAQSYQPKISHF